MYFTVRERCRLAMVTVYTDVAGDRLFELKNGRGEVIAATRVTLAAGANDIMLGIELLPSAQAYLLTTNASVNMETLGTSSPQLYRSDENVEFPYNIGSAMTLDRSVHGTRYFYYFYSWVVETIESCESERVEGRIHVLTGTKDLASGHHSVLVSPNPSGGLMSVKWKPGIFGDNLELEVIDLNGELIRRVFLEDTGEFRGVLEGMVPGWYVIRLHGSKSSGIGRWLIQ